MSNYLLKLTLSIFCFSTFSVRAQISFSKLTTHALSSMTTTIENNANGAGAWITGDFDNDGDLDIVGRVAADNALAYWRNDGTVWSSLTGASNPFNGITFTAGVTSFNNNNAVAIDIDGDGDIDVYNGGVNEVYQNNNNGTFTKLTSHLLSSMTTTIESNANGAGAWITGDFDSDGDLDIVGRVAADNALAYWRNDKGIWTSLTGTSNPFNGITFTAGVTSFNNNNAVALDIDSDGDVDVYNGGVNEVYRNNNNGTFTKLTSHLLSSMTTTIENNANGAGAWIAADFDGDGDLDIAGRVAADNAIAYWRNDNGSWTSLTGAANPFNGITFTAGVTSFNNNNVSAIDIDNDGDYDLFNAGVNELYLASGAAPRVTSTTPAHLATDVSPSSNIVLNFTENVTAGTGNIYLRRYPDSALALTIPANSASVTGSGTSTITINPPVDFQGNIGYFITLDRNAFADADGVIPGRFSRIIKVRVPLTDTNFLRFTITSTLPVTLINFTAAIVNKKAVLQWQTASEQNSRDFTIQYSKDGVGWKDIGKIAAAGNSTQIRDYRFEDTQDLLAVNYYRILQSDRDGKTSQSVVKVLRTDKNVRVVLYPNPATDFIHIKLPYTGETSVTIYDSYGRTVRSLKRTGNSMTILLDALTKGSYRMVLVQEGQQYTEQFLVK